MSRILFAAARGARVQTSYNHGNDWRTVSGMVFKPEECEGLPHIQRIHPDDEHLQYGPISSALRRTAINGEVFAAEIPYIIGYWDFTRDEAYTFIENRKHAALFLLILSEALADEGL